LRKTIGSPNIPVEYEENHIKKLNSDQKVEDRKISIK